jgi:cobalt-zinc-cadmium efflux system protein
VLLAAFMAVEIVAGLVAGSLALIADAGHMLTDAAALGMALVAATLAARPAGGRWTWGWGRVEVLAAQANGLLLAILGIGVVFAAVRRLRDPRDVDGEVVLAVAVAGIAVTVVATLILARASRESLNVRGAFLHVALDVVAFAGTAVAAVLVLATGWDGWDPVASLAVAVLLFFSAWSLLRDSARIVLERSPAGIDPHDVGHVLVGHPGVVEAHDLHVWTVTSGFAALSAHVLVEPGADCHGIRRELETVLAEQFGVTHTTLQVEHAESGPQAVELGRAEARSTPVERR